MKYKIFKKNDLFGDFLYPIGTIVGSNIFSYKVVGYFEIRDNNIIRLSKDWTYVLESGIAIFSHKSYRDCTKIADDMVGYLLLSLPDKMAVYWDLKHKTETEFKVI